eukprot:TRINITY_DN18779_c0_g2_i2.p1 TRINITY_DN18779_c0_g2~~TRINITY_DN18779_c0_g2_i2.p1  ORF type:complete len:115 (+),score=12.52 TRINITY_DN18779_c0_g2_i2:127-471(+)
MSGGPRPPPYQPNCTVINWDNGSSWVLLQTIDTVHLIFMNHLDVGYNGIPLTGFINNILNIYFHEYYPRAISVSKTLKSLGSSQSLVYTDRKSGSAGMPRPISYAVFCLKKKIS